MFIFCKARAFRLQPGAVAALLVAGVAAGLGGGVGAAVGGGLRPGGEAARGDAASRLLGRSRLDARGVRLRHRVVRHLHTREEAESCISRIDFPSRSEETFR